MSAPFPEPLERRPTMRSVKVWDPLVRFLHWGTALLFAANFTVFADEGWGHLTVGYLLTGLVLLRLLWGLIGTRPARFSSFRPSLRGVLAHIWGLVIGRAEPHLSHNPLGAVMVFNLLASLLLLCVTGIVATAGLGWMEGPHEFLANYTLASVGLHITGVFFETKRSKVNLTKAMVTGRKEIPDPSS
jgi:cytochrome b